MNIFLSAHLFLLIVYLEACITVGVSAAASSLTDRLFLYVARSLKIRSAHRYPRFYKKHRIGYHGPEEKIALLEAIVKNKKLPAHEREFAATMLDSKLKKAAQEE